MKTKVKFLIEKDFDPSNKETFVENHVFAYFPEEVDHVAMYDKIKTTFFSCYAHVGQHSSCHPDYAKECKEAKYNQYQDLLKELIRIGYKNLQVLNKEDIELHRKPTQSEINFGEGATHYQSFALPYLINKKGDLKKRIKAKHDGLIYSR